MICYEKQKTSKIPFRYRFRSCGLGDRNYLRHFDNQINTGMNEWIEQRVKMIAEGFSLEQIQRECWDYCHREYLGILNLEAIIGRAMQLYAEVIKRSGV